MFVPIHDANPLEHIHFHYATVGLIAINVLIFSSFEWLNLFDPDSLLAFALVPAALFGDAVRPDEISLVPEQATLLTYAFIHADIWHLAGNMIFLWVFGDNVEDAMGHWRFLLFYGLCTIGSGLLFALVTPEPFTFMIGASGAVAGVVAAYLLLHPRVKVWIFLTVFVPAPLRINAAWALGAWIAFQILGATVWADGVIAWWAHIGGIIIGAVLILFMRRRGVKLLDRDLPLVATAKRVTPTDER